MATRDKFARRGRGDRRRRPEVRMTEEVRAQKRIKIRKTTKRSRASKTRNLYTSYMRAINEWYNMHHPELCTDEGHLNTQNMREIIRDEEQLYEQAEIFKLFIHSREHFKDLNADGRHSSNCPRCVPWWIPISFCILRVDVCKEKNRHSSAMECSFEGFL